MHFLIDLVDDQNQRKPTGTEHSGQLPVERRQSRTPIHDKEQQLSTCDCCLRGRVGCFGKIRIG